jgi:hypothetical protein
VLEQIQNSKEEKERLGWQSGTSAIASAQQMGGPEFKPQSETNPSQREREREREMDGL